MPDLRSRSLLIHWIARCLSFVCLGAMILTFVLSFAAVQAQSSQTEQDRAISIISERAATLHTRVEKLEAIAEKNQARIIELEKTVSIGQGVGGGLGVALLLLQLVQIVTGGRGRTT